ncbi:hypothetical protein H310_15079, partial [Aphanomyces invadans]
HCNIPKLDSMGIWCDDMDKTWLEEMVYQVVILGKKARSGFKKEAWSAVLAKLNAKHDLTLSMTQLKSRHDTIKTMFSVVSKLVNSSGMGWEAATCRVVCQYTTWDVILEGKPKA